MSYRSLCRALFLSTGFALLMIAAGCQSQPGAGSKSEAGYLLDKQDREAAEAAEAQQAETEAAQRGDQRDAAKEAAEQAAEAQAARAMRDETAEGEAALQAAATSAADEEGGEASEPAAMQKEAEAAKAAADEAADEATSEEKPASSEAMGELAAAQVEGVDSPILLKPMGQLLAEAIIARREAGKPLPDDYKSSEFVVSVIRSLRLQHPDLFRVSDREKARYKAGDFQTEAKLRRVRLALAEIERRKVQKSTLVDYLAQQYHLGELKGIRAVLAARLLEAEVRAALGGTAQGSE